MVDQLRRFSTRGVHNFSLGCLDAYFHLIEDLAAGKAFILGSSDGILVLSRRKKVYCFEASEDSDLQLLRYLQKEASIYSLQSIGLSGERKFSEVYYDLDEVLNSKTYPNKKKRYNHLTYPFRWMKNNEVEVRVSTDFEVESIRSEVETLHSDWVSHKLEDGKTYRIMFPQKRYLRCFERLVACQRDRTSGISYIGYFFFLKGELVSVRVIFIDRKSDWGYDLANFTNTWSSPSQISNYFDVYALSLLRKEGIRFFNCGAALNKYLQTFKTHLPSHILESFAYSRSKKVEENRTFF